MRASWFVHVLALGLILGSVLIGAGSSSVQSAGPAPGMSLSSTYQFVAVGETFTITISADPAPDAQIAGLASEVLLPSGLTWVPRPSCEDEVLVARQDLGQLGFCSSFITGLLGGIGHSVVSDLGAPPLAPLDLVPGSVVPIIEIDVTCVASDSYTAVLLAVPDSSFGAVYFDVAANPLSVKTVPFDYDGDTFSNDVAATITIECLEDVDTDGDGCTDVQELRADELLGGQRNPEYFWDFYDANRDRAISVLDFFAVLERFGAVGNPAIDPLSDPPPVPAYHTRFDRLPALPGANAWELQPADGAISILDFFSLLVQFGHTCVEAPA